MTRTTNNFVLTAWLAVAAALPFSIQAQTTYSDSTGDVFTTAGGGILDITSVEVSNDNVDLIFKINLAGNPVSTDWGKYLIGLDTTVGGTATGNGWGRPINMASGMDFWVGSWADGGNGAEVYNWTGTAWNLQNATYGTAGGLSFSKNASSVTIRYPYASLGLSVNDSFDFDVYSSGGGGGDGAIDALSTNGIAAGDWGNSFTTVSNLTYTITGVPPPTNQITFTVDMGVPIAIFAANPSDTAGFDPNNDTVYVRGNFNGWATQPAYALVRVGTSSIYSNTVEIAGFPGTVVNYKFFAEFFPGEETPLLTCNAAREFVITNTTQTVPQSAWSDRSLSDPTNTITFQVNMALEQALGRFDPAIDGVFARGSFNGWGTFGPLTNNPAGDTNIFIGVVTVENWPIGACVNYKYWNNNATAPNGGYESGSDRQFNLTASDYVLPVRAFNDADICDVIEATNLVTFSINMAGAIGTDNTVYDGTQNVYLNGDFAGWWGWGTPPPAYQMTKSGDIYSLTVPLPPGNNLRLVYKYSLGGADNEAGFGQDHVRYIRTLPGETNYSFPQDNWLGTNATFLANRTEPKFGNLVAVPGAPGQVQIQWLGLKCVQLQSISNLTTGTWVTYPATDGLSTSNKTVVGSSEFFRLIDTGN